MRDYQRPLAFDFGILADAQAYYARSGFVEKPVPWVIDEDILRETLPPDVALYRTLGGVLVASAEQSFIQLLDRGWDEPGSYQATTPCFRDEQHDALHSPYFMKTELFDNATPTLERLDEVLELALHFFRQFTPARIEVQEDGTYDIVGLRSGLELGSYGIRTRRSFTWLYGTGVALPRLQAVQKAEEEAATKS
jgi:hypothetical protein